MYEVAPSRTLVAHALADLFPLMSGDEYAQLKESISKQGVCDPIVLHDGRIVDGRNRWQACRELKKSCPAIDWDGAGSLVEFVMAKNLHRRHLSPSQLAMVGKDAEPYFAAEAKDRQRASALANQPQSQKVERIPPSEKSKARDAAAKAVGVNPRYVSDAKKVAAASPELEKKVRTGEMSLPQAVKALKGESPEKTESITRQKSMSKKLAEAKKRPWRDGKFLEAELKSAFAKYRDTAPSIQAIVSVVCESVETNLGIKLEPLPCRPQQ